MASKFVLSDEPREEWLVGLDRLAGGVIAMHINGYAIVLLHPNGMLELGDNVNASATGVQVDREGRPKLKRKVARLQ